VVGQPRRVDPLRIPLRYRGGRTYLVECFASNRREVEAVARRARRLGQVLRGTGPATEYLAGLVVRADEQVLLIVTGGEVAAVRAACLDVGLAVDRVSEVTLRAALSGPAASPPARRAGDRRR
jgi:hypothetical protein